MEKQIFISLKIKIDINFACSTVALMSQVGFGGHLVEVCVWLTRK